LQNVASKTYLGRNGLLLFLNPSISSAIQWTIEPQQQNINPYLLVKNISLAYLSNLYNTTLTNTIGPNQKDVLNKYDTFITKAVSFFGSLSFKITTIQVTISPNQVEINTALVSVLNDGSKYENSFESNLQIQTNVYFFTILSNLYYYQNQIWVIKNEIDVLNKNYKQINAFLSNAQTVIKTFVDNSQSYASSAQAYATEAETFALQNTEYNYEEIDENFIINLADRVKLNKTKSKQIDNQSKDISTIADKSDDLITTLQKYIPTVEQTPSQIDFLIGDTVSKLLKNTDKSTKQVYSRTNILSISDNTKNAILNKYPQRNNETADQQKSLINQNFPKIDGSYNQFENENSDQNSIIPYSNQATTKIKSNITTQETSFEMNDQTKAKMIKQISTNYFLPTNLSGYVTIAIGPQDTSTNYLTETSGIVSFNFTF